MLWFTWLAANTSMWMNDVAAAWLIWGPTTDRLWLDTFVADLLATLVVFGASRTFGAGSDISGPGTVRFNSGNFTIAGDYDNDTKPDVFILRHGGGTLFVAHFGPQPYRRGSGRVVQVGADGLGPLRAAPAVGATCGVW